MNATLHQTLASSPHHACLSSYSAQSLHIHEQNQKIHVTTQALIALPHLLIRNNSQKEIWVLAIDQCIDLPASTKRADGALCTVDVFIVFELKLEVKYKNRKDARAKAYDQLESSIIFLEQDPTFRTILSTITNKKAFIVFRKRKERQTNPSPKVVLFEQKGFKLVEDNVIDF